MVQIVVRALVLGMVVLSLACARQSPQDVEQTLMQMERDWSEALVKVDRATLDRIIASDWIVTEVDGQVLTKAQADANLGTVSKFDAFVADDMTVRVLGDMAIVTGRSTIKGTYKGKDISGQERWTDVFVPRDGRWQAVSTHVSSLANPAVGVDPSLDPVKLEPGKNTVLFENDRVRVLDYRQKPGQKDVMHAHPPSFVYALSAGVTSKETLAGETTQDMPAIKAGDVTWRERRTHFTENTGSTDAHVLVVELK